MEKTFENQNNLPIRPIPKLEETCNRFLEWVQPLLSEEEFSNTQNIVDKFKSDDGDGIKLQNELIKWSKTESISNWSEPLWYDIYLESRQPLLINSNVFYILEDKKDILNKSQSFAAASLILSVLNFKSLIDKEELEVDKQAGEPQCMNQYKNLFSASRIPRKIRDEFLKTPSSKHIIVLFKGHIFSIDVINEFGENKSFSEIETALSYILSSVKEHAQLEIGIFTTMEREKWAENREILLSLSDQNNNSIVKIDSSILVLCLDDDEVNSLEESSKKYLHGYGRNRWFDKSLQFIVSKNNKLGLNLEHTGFDGSSITKMAKYIYENVDTFAKIEINEDKKLQIKPEKIDFELNEDLKNLINQRIRQLNDYVSNTEIRVSKFELFGKNLIKTFNISPDAFVQLAFQLAQYKLFGRCYSSYEAVMVRKYLHGRIEVSHCVSLESIQFIENMLSQNCDDKTTIDSLRIAAKKQSARLKECRTGHGIDSHLLALIKMYRLNGKNIGVNSLPTVFADKGYKILTHSTICTSTTAAVGVDLVGYGPVVEDGFAVRYIKNPDSINFNMTSRTNMKKELDNLLLYIQESLVDMAKLMERNQ